MIRRTIEALSSVREVEDQPRTVEGIAVPYGAVATDTDIGRETFAGGAFRESVDHWMKREDGARMAFRPAHKEKPVGTVTVLDDTPDGVRFRAAIFDTPAGDDYLAQVRAGLNGVSVEAGLDPKPGRMRDGTAVHRTARLYAIAGSISPAYDGARIALRDMEETMTEPTTPEPAPEPAPIVQRDAVMADAAVTIQPRAPITIQRNALVYGREAALGPHGERFGFISDGYKAFRGDRDAADRLARYERFTQELMDQAERDAAVALRVGDVVSTELGGAYPNEYLPGLLLPAIMKGRPLTSFFGRYSISNALPKIFPKVTTSTSVAVAAAELTNPAASDFATTAETTTPLLYGAETIVSRWVLDGSSPSAEAMIMQDMMEAYAQASEAVTVTKVEATASVAAAGITAATPYGGLVANVVEYYGDYFKPATGVFIPPALFAVALAELGTDGRPLIPFWGPTNSDATVNAGGVGGNILGAGFHLSWGSTANVCLFMRPEDYVVFESPIARFSYDQVAGPTGVRIGIWAYLAVGDRRGGNQKTAA